MLEKLRKFSQSFFAKIFLFIIAIPFVFWGMGDLFRSGNQKTIVKIENEKISIQEFINYINSRSSSIENINSEIIENLLSGFIGQKLIEQEVKILSQGMKDDEIKKNKKDFEAKAKKRIKVGLVLNAFGEGILYSNFSSTIVRASA